MAWLLGRPDIGSLAWPLTGAMASLGFLVLDMVQVRLPAPPSDDG